MAANWTPLKELTPDLRGGWVMISRGRGNLGHIEQVSQGRQAAYRCKGRQGIDLGEASSLREAAKRLWDQPKGPSLDA